MFFLVSALLISWSSHRWTCYAARSGADAFWIFIAGVMLQIGATACLLSLFQVMNPASWILVQLIVSGLTLVLGGAQGRAEVRLLSEAWARWRSGLSAFLWGLSVWAWLALLAIGLVLAASLWVQMATPLAGFDERMYHASRVIYWIQNQSVFPFETHNVRQTMIPFGSELWFLWPVLMTKTEALGRLVFWFAYPLAAVGQYVLLRALKVSQTVALMGVLILITTPLVASSTLGLKPEIWSMVTLLGVSYWAVSLCSRPEGEGRRVPCFFLGVFAVLSINVRSFPLSLLPALFLVILWAPGSVPRIARFRAFVAGGVCAVLMSGLLVPLVSNTALYHHPLGPKSVRDIVSASPTPQVVYTHAVRFAFLMLELPSLPLSPQARAHVSNAANQLIAALGAGAPLAGEGQGPWPGRFVYSLPEHSTRFSLWGILWIPTLLVAMALLGRNVAATWTRVQLTPVSAQTLLALPLLVAVLFGARWMAQSEVPGRFLIGPYTLLLPVGITLFFQRMGWRKWAQALGVVAIAYAAFHPMRVLATNAENAVKQPLSAKTVNEPFADIVGSLLPANARVLLVGGNDIRDYSLFSPTTRYSSVVTSWGTGPFDPSRMGRLITSQKISHIIIENDTAVGSPWSPLVDTSAMVKWLNTRPGVAAIPLRAPNMRMYQIEGAAVMNDKPFETLAWPAVAPLIEVHGALGNHVGIDPVLLDTSWPVENLGGVERGFLWMGQGAREGIVFGLWSREQRDVDLRFDVSPGHGLTIPGRRVMVQLGGVPVGVGEHAFVGRTSIVVRIRLQPGRNVVHFFALDTATVKPLPNGDTRNLVVGLHGVHVEPGAEDTGNRPGSLRPAVANGGNLGRDADLSAKARRAVGLITRQQQVEGYWRTSYTSGPRFADSTFEMNTYVTSMMVDILGSPPVAPGLAGSLERARTHLRHQIEAGGLVRYHGRPDGAAMAIFGLCPITPDADDTSLVWRLAPSGDMSLRAQALATLREYRTAEGLYKTWMGERNQFRCIDPGTDPNPPDIAIQMHVYLWLAQVDPPAARELCSALQTAAGQDRIWVYYDKAPLVPVMRQADMKAAGCALALPPTRTATPLPDQKIWLDAGHMLSQLAAGNKAKGMPPAAQVIEVLRELSKDDFARVRTHPPLLYHNDFSASVRRFYWADDVGYAIWLRLYQESLRAGLLASDALAGSPAVVNSHTRQTP